MADRPGDGQGRFPGVFVHESAYVDDRVAIGAGTKIWHFAHILAGTSVGQNCVLGQNVMAGPNVAIGDGCKIQNNVALYEGVTLEDDVFCGPSCVFTNTHNPRAFIGRKSEFRPTLVRKGASIGANATIVCGATLGACCFIAAGAVVIAVAAVFLAGFLLVHRIIHSPYGQVLKSIRENEPRAISLGYGVGRYKLAAFVMSAALAGLAGGTKALVFQFATLTDVGWQMSGEVILMTLLGGIGTPLGPVVGAVILTLLPEVLRFLSDYRLMINGAIIVLAVLFMPRGLLAWHMKRTVS